MCTRAYTTHRITEQSTRLFRTRRRVRDSRHAEARQPKCPNSLECTACTPPDLEEKSHGRDSIYRPPRSQAPAADRRDRARQRDRHTQTDSHRARGALRNEQARRASRQIGIESASDDQIFFDVTRTRLTLQHMLDQQVGSETTDQIRETAQAEAERYMQRIGGK